MNDDVNGIFATEIGTVGVELTYDNLLAALEYMDNERISTFPCQECAHPTSFGYPPGMRCWGCAHSYLLAAFIRDDKGVARIEKAALRMWPELGRGDD